MGKKKVEHVVFDGMRKIKKKYNISEYNKKTHRDERQGILKVSGTASRNIAEKSSI